MSAPLRRRGIGLYAAGLLANLAFLALLLGSETARRNLYPPEGPYAGNIWRDTDVMTYVASARNFVAHGVFGEGLQPDYHRTVGYPWFLAAFMAAAPAAWPLAVIVAQCLLFPVLYPALASLADTVLPAGSGAASPAVAWLVASGAYVAWAPVLLTDLMFAVLLGLGLALCARAAASGSLAAQLASVFLLGLAAQVRPTMGLYPAVHAALFVVLARRAGTWPVARRGFLASLVLLAVLCNGPALRNLANHGFLYPSDALEVNLFKQLTRRVLAAAGDEDRYTRMQDELERRSGFRERVRLQRRLAFEAIAGHPWLTLRQVGLQAVAALASSHWLRAARFFETGWSLGPPGPRRSTALDAAGLLFSLGALAACLLCAAQLLRLARSGDAALAAALAAWIAYFLLPAFFDAAGARMRLPVEGLLALLASAEARLRFASRAAVVQ